MANLYDKAGLVNIPVGYQDGFLYNIKPEDNTLGFRFNRDSAATRVNKEGLIEQVGYFGPELVKNGNFSELGPELVVNGNFSNWTNDNPDGWTITGTENENNYITEYQGKARYVSDGSTLFMSQNILTTGKFYKVTADIVVNSGGGMRFQLGANGTHHVFTTTQSIVLYAQQDGADGNLQIIRQGATDFTIDNVSVKQVDPNDYWDLVSLEFIGDNTFKNTGFNGRVYQSFATTVGSKYKVSATVNSGTWNIVASTNTNTSGTIQSTGNTTVSEFFEFTATGTVSYLVLYNIGASSSVGSITNASVVEVQGDKPRIDYTDSLTSPSFLLEPQSTNLVEFSEDFSKWNNTDITIGENGISPTGETNANLIQTGTANSDQVNETFTISATNTATYSIFIKRVSGAEWVDFLVVKSGFSNSLKVWFNISSGLVGSNVANGTTTFDSASVKDFGNGWYRLKVTTTDTTNNTSFNIRVRTASADASDTRVSNSSYYLWGAQLEQLSYASSYIPTAGSTVTRAQETCNNAGNVSTFNSTEGVLYAEIASLTTSASSGERRIVVAKNGDTNNVVRIYYNNTANTIQYKVRVASSNVCDLTYDLGNSTGYHKICGKWKQNDFALWVDGVKVATDTSGSVFPANTLNTLNFSNANANSDYFYGKTKGVYVFNEALTDDELQQLTGPEYNSFAALAAAYNYTVI